MIFKPGHSVKVKADSREGVVKKINANKIEVFFGLREPVGLFYPEDLEPNAKIWCDISEVGYVEEMLKRLGERSFTDQPLLGLLEEMTPWERYRLLCGWFHGHESWATTHKEKMESQGLYITTDPNANGVLK